MQMGNTHLFGIGKFRKLQKAPKNLCNHFGSTGERKFSVSHFSRVGLHDTCCRAQEA